jgi:hypothetical protein
MIFMQRQSQENSQVLQASPQKVLLISMTSASSAFKIAFLFSVYLCVLCVLFDLHLGPGFAKLRDSLAVLLAQRLDDFADESLGLLNASADVLHRVHEA